MNRKIVPVVLVCIILLSGTFAESLFASEPDLVVSDITMSPPSPIMGQSIAITVYIKNQGTSSAGSFMTSYYIDGTRLGEWSISSLLAGATITASFNWIAVLGTHTVSAFADSSYNVGESNEANNQKEKTFIVSAAGPDIGVEIRGQAGVIIHSYPLERTCGHQYGIWIEESTDITVIGNSVTNNSDTGIYVVNSYKVSIISNVVSNSRVGIQIQSSRNCNIVIRDNNISNNTFENVYVVDSSNISISNNNILNAQRVAGILIYQSSETNIASNTVITSAHSDNGISLSSSVLADVINNTVAGNKVGIAIEGSSNNTVRDNTIRSNDLGMNITEPTPIHTANNNTIYHNNFINNSIHSWVQEHSWGELPNPPPPSKNCWNKPYPIGGNYWSDYVGSDVSSGIYQNVSSCPDGIGDTPYLILEPDNRDQYPLMSPWPSNFGTLSYRNSSVGIFSNSTLANLEFNEKSGQIRFSVQNGTFCRVAVPKELLDGAMTVLVDDAPATSFSKWDNAFVFISFTYDQSIHNVKIMGEYVMGAGFQQRETACELADINGDGKVDILDIARVAQHFGHHTDNCPLGR